ncbi:murein DD-endopeptidase MepM/ murein hydrolase activator NlpD [Elusimicrobium posterum]|uniref:M23 family metallopeptidase n=1 Tax=Elusimicrobium posterum TaxID=3116653 RepID=UPI003C707477
MLNLLSNIIALLGERVDILIMPRTMKSRKFKMTFGFLLLTILLLAVMFLTTCYVFVRNYDYSLTKADNQMMKAKIAVIAEELERGRKYLELTKTTDKQMRQMLGMPAGKEADLSGFDGKKLTFEEILNRTSGDIETDDFKEYVDTIEKVAKARLLSYQDIAWYFANKKSTINATPSIRPSQGRITSGFGTRLSPFGGQTVGNHKGLDFADKPDSPIVATADGVVRHTGWTNGFGQAVLIDHGYGYSTLYGHVTAIKVKGGDVVKRGDTIATMGTTGRSTGVHLHYEVWIDGQPVNPRKYFD